MKNQTDRHTGKSIIFFIVLLIVLALMSLFFLLHQMYNKNDFLSGQIIAVNGEEVTVINVHGKETVLILSDETRIRGGRESLKNGLYIYSFGHFDDKGNFESQGVRIIKK